MDRQKKVAPSSVEPLFIKDIDMPSDDISAYTVVRAITRVVDPDVVDGVQRIGRLWRIYFKTLQGRSDLMIRKTVVIDRKTVPLYEQNPFRTNQLTPNDQKDKLTIKGLPISVSNDEVVNLLQSKGAQLSTQVMFAHIRNEHGSLTSFKNGDRYVYCQPFNPPMPRQQRICGFYCAVYHHGKDTNNCKSCDQSCHKAGDLVCPARAEEGSIISFSGFEHPLSNHFMTPIYAFNKAEPFKTVEHAFFYKMAVDLGHAELADKIKNAKHAGVVKRLSKELEEENRRAWEDDNFDVLRELLREKARTCEQFYNCLMMYKDKLLAEATVNKRWGTGLSKWVTNVTKPKFWPGQNLMGVLLMELTNELLSSTDTSPMDIGIVSELDGEENDEEEDEEEKDEREQTADNEEKSETEIQDKPIHGSRTGRPRGTLGDIDKSSSTSAPPSTSANKTTGDATKEKNKKKSHEKNNGSNDIIHKDNKTTASDKSNKSNSKHKSKENSGKNHTTPKRKMPDIRSFVNSVTGKRKTLETTPEKNENEKKSNR